MFKTVSQIKIEYRASRLSEGAAGTVHGGDRLPWLELDHGDNYAPLTSLDWQVHVYGEPNSGTVHLCQDRALPLHAFPWNPHFVHAGLERDTVYLVRPDGYIGLADAEAKPANLERYLRAFSLTSSSNRRR